MAALVLKSIPSSLHRRLQQEAKRHRRSMTQEAIQLLEQGLGFAPIDFPPPAKGRRPLTQDLLDQAIHEGRA
jgi:hypothetical protein